LEAIPGIGKDLAAKIREYATTGKVAKHEALKAEFPAGVLDLLRVPGLGPKTVMLYQERNITGVEGARTLARAETRRLPHSKRTEENILKGIEAVRRGSERLSAGGGCSPGDRRADQGEVAVDQPRSPASGGRRR
jgi:DNA polymerase (family 10)